MAVVATFGNPPPPSPGYEHHSTSEERLELYGVASSRTRRALWVLEESGLSYSFRKLNLRKGEHRLPAYLSLNPNGKVPTLVDGDLTLFESAAICNYVANQVPEAKLIPHLGTRERALYDQWMFWVVSELEQPLWSIGKHRFALPEKLRVPAIIDVALVEWKRPAKVLADALEGRNYLVGESFSCADIMVAHTLQWAVSFGVPLGSEVLTEYLARMTARPAFSATNRWD